MPEGAEYKNISKVPGKNVNRIWGVNKFSIDTHMHARIYQINNQQKRTYRTLEMSLAGTKSREEQPAQHIQQTEQTMGTRQVM